MHITKRRITTFSLFVLLSTVLTMAVWLFILDLPPSDAPVDTVSIHIGHGMSGTDIAATLQRRNIVRSGRFFTLVAKLSGLSRSFKAGTHPLEPGLTALDIAHRLSEIPPAEPDLRVTVIEGLTIRETAASLMKQAAIDSASFVTLAGDSSLVTTLGVDKESLEGYLYPDTYFVRPGTDPREMIVRMVTRFNNVFADSLHDRAREIGMTQEEIVTLASIIECEVTADDERPIVSSVFHRRLERGRPLDANPTIQYAIGEKRRLLNEDLTVESPYNTYLHAGLPPGPIASPGLKSILAALYPADTKYLYFVADGKGRHVFSRTIAEHTRAVREYRRFMRRERLNRR